MELNASFYSPSSKPGNLQNNASDSSDAAEALTFPVALSRSCSLPLLLCVLVSLWLRLLPQHAAELRRTSRVAWKDSRQIRSSEVLRGNLAKHVAEVRRQRQVAAFV